MASACAHSSPLPHALTPTLPSPLSPTQRDRDPFFVPRASSHFNARHARSYSQEGVAHLPPTPSTPAAAPILSTALRAAHRRARSTAAVPTARSLLSPPAAEVARSPLSRFPSYTSENMASTVHGFAHHDPFTPVKNSSVRIGDSPFSDYFSDNGRDGEEDAPSPEKQRMLVRLNKLQSQLMQSEPESERETLGLVERKVNEIELHLSTLHSQTRMPPELEDSGLFMEEDERDMEDETPDGRSSPVTALQSSLDGAVDDITQSPGMDESKQAEYEFLLAESQRVLDSVTKAQEQLRQRHDELKALHDAHIVQMDDRERQIDTLHSENETLKSDLDFDHSELLFLKLQFKALEIDISALDSGAQRLESYAPEIKNDIQKVKRERIAEEMRRWERDWEDVDARMRRRRGRYAGVFGKCDSAMDELVADEGDWQLETVEKSDGRVQRIIIRRLNGKGEPLDDGMGVEEEAEAEAEAEEEEIKIEEVEEEIVESVEVEVQEEPEPRTTDPSVKEDEDEKVTNHPEPDLLKRHYTHRTTQTIDSGSAHERLELFATESSILCEYMIRNDNDCAITTSSEDNDDDDFSDSDDWSDDAGAEGQPEVKTPWQELLDGLANLAGMGEGGF